MSDLLVKEAKNIIEKTGKSSKHFDKICEIEPCRKIELKIFSVEETWSVTKKKTIQRKRARNPEKKAKPKTDTPVHPWRACPYGEHQVITHSRHNPPSKAHPEGSISTVHWHCARNPSGKDQLYPDEIRRVASQYFQGLKNKPCSLTLGFSNGARYDAQIAGWTQYWNDVLKPSDPLDPNFVKALIATESGFDPDVLADKKNQNSARGLMQITNSTREILGDDGGEIKDHCIATTRSDLNDPDVNICAGVRWLFHKRGLLSSKIGRQATWLETVHHYKGTSKTTKNRENEIITLLSGSERSVKIGKA